MKSTITKAYGKEILPDDGVKLTFREGRNEAHEAALSTAIFMGYLFMLLAAWLAIGLALVLVLGTDSLRTAGVASLVIVAGGVWQFRKTLFRNNATLILSQKGLVFGEQQLVFRETTLIDVHTEEPYGKMYPEVAHVFAQTGGRKIRITRPMKPELAHALLNEINEYCCRVDA